MNCRSSGKRLLRCKNRGGGGKSARFIVDAARHVKLPLDMDMG